ncbi:MAG: single-stranded-DNA-specific exonuclease RecJ [Pyrinomonadaceae bacterium]
MEKEWIVSKHDLDEVNGLASRLGVSPLLAALLILRGHTDTEAAKRFLEPGLGDLNDPKLLLGMDDAVERLCAAIARGEQILIWGDYDVDGTTGTVLLRKALHRLGAVTDFHIPNRFTEGYGLNIPALEEAANKGTRLVVTVDCGIRSFEALEWARSRGLDVIVTDHHLSDPERGAPPATAVVNPNQAGCDYPDKQLAGVGVAFKLAQALLGDALDPVLLGEFLEIAAIGTVADIMKLTGENRSIVTLGLRHLNQTRNYGLRALMEVADCTSEMTSLHIGFRIAPRINAAGRMDAASQVVELLEADTPADARRLAGILDGRNRERRRVQELITEQAMSAATDFPDDRIIVVGGDGWHRGVIGLAASRIAERLARPAVVLSIENGVAHGSARSFGGFDIVEAFDRCSDVFIQYGGHAAAAGLQIETGMIDELRSRLNEFAGERIDGEGLPNELLIEAVVSTKTLGLEILKDLDRLEPYGAANPKPVFLTRDLVLRRDPFVMKDRHLKFDLADPVGKRFEAVWWDGVARSKGRTLEEGSRIEIAYTAEANHWQGNTRLQLVTEDIRTID